MPQDAALLAALDFHRNVRIGRVEFDAAEARSLGLDGAAFDAVAAAARAARLQEGAWRHRPACAGRADSTQAALERARRTLHPASDDPALTEDERRIAVTAEVQSDLLSSRLAAALWERRQVVHAPQAVGVLARANSPSVATSDASRSLGTHVASTPTSVPITRHRRLPRRAMSASQPCLVGMPTLCHLPRPRPMIDSPPPPGQWRSPQKIVERLLQQQEEQQQRQQQQQQRQQQVRQVQQQHRVGLSLSSTPDRSSVEIRRAECQCEPKTSTVAPRPLTSGLTRRIRSRVAMYL